MNNKISNSKLKSQNSKILNSKKINTKQNTNSKQYDLEDRTKEFAKEIRRFFRKSSIINYTLNDINQVLRSSGSIGANYIEANESMSKKDFVYRIKICKKETKETRYWLDILKESYESINYLLEEAT
ncbi:four helix bundle protein, partial [Candidatus Dojkabacteria bacterium]|nr:four helix bundle protein [Candidatus Dojkabacteria bacterium]